LAYPLLINIALSKNVDTHSLSNQLEEILNKDNSDLMKDIFLQNSFNQFNKEYRNFKKKYKDPKWSIKTKSNDPNKSFLDIRITSTRKIGEQVYNLSTKQTVHIETYRNKIKVYKVINEESIINSQNSPLVVKIISPNKVLTGERYEVNLILEKPLDDSLIASGIIILRNQNNKKISNELFDIKPNQSGGLFKYIKAPLKPGFQTISAIITHPEGIYSITKKIKVGL
tara:strand:+ start:621 stop:1301 length:681 start_codon:yes stop_codon:yes gene_type:complete